MTPDTIEQTYEYRIAKIVASVLKNHNQRPTSAAQMFDFLENKGAESFANSIVADMVQWDEEENWFKKVMA